MGIINASDKIMFKNQKKKRKNMETKIFLHKAPEWNSQLSKAS